MQMHWCTAKVNLAGQGFTIFWYDETQMVSWPEVQVIMLMHGEENVTDVRACAIGETGIGNEKERLMLKYGFKPVEATFPGRNPRMETLMPGDEGLVLPQADQWGKIIYNAPVQVAALNISENGHPIEEPPGPVNPPPAPRPDGENNDEEEDDSAKQPMADVTAGAVFKPGKHPRPHKGA